MDDLPQNLERCASQLDAIRNLSMEAGEHQFDWLTGHQLDMLLAPISEDLHKMKAQLAIKQAA